MSFIEKFEGKSIIPLEKYEGEDLKVNPSYNPSEYDGKSDYIKICVFDLETTGTNKDSDKILEIAMKVMQINKHSGKECIVIDEYESFEDPEEPIDPLITQITGINNEMTDGKKIDWSCVSEILKKSDLIVAHNSAFDRGFLEKRIEFRLPWACSYSDIDWLERGFCSSKLELLCIWHGFFFGAHRAMNDVDALIHLMIHDNYLDNKPIVELINNARQPYHKVVLTFSYDENIVKDVKSMRYRWDGNNKKWWKIYKTHEEMAEETSKLSDKVSKELIKLSSYDKFKID